MLNNNGVQIANHITFDQLSLEEKFLLIVSTTSAFIAFGNFGRQPQEILTSTARDYWDQSDLAASELSDFDRMSDRLCGWLKSNRANNR